MLKKQLSRYSRFILHGTKYLDLLSLVAIEKSLKNNHTNLQAYIQSVCDLTSQIEKPKESKAWNFAFNFYKNKSLNAVNNAFALYAGDNLCRSHIDFWDNVKEKGYLIGTSSYILNSDHSLDMKFSGTELLNEEQIHEAMKNFELLFENEYGEKYCINNWQEYLKLAMEFFPNTQETPSSDFLLKT